MEIASAGAGRVSGMVGTFSESTTTFVNREVESTAEVFSALLGELEAVVTSESE